MNLKEICPCPKVNCENRGDCARCVSAHLKKQSLNACSFYTVLPFLEEAVNKSPQSPTAQALQEMIDKRLKGYQELRRQHGRSEEAQAEMLQKMAEYCNQGK